MRLSSFWSLAVLVTGVSRSITALSGSSTSRAKHFRNGGFPGRRGGLRQ